ncbi:MAG: hypothetical protein ACPL1A_04495 [Candidatus Kapaibacteriota bacterium]
MKKQINNITSYVLIFTTFFNVVGVIFLLLLIRNYNYNSIRQSFFESHKDVSKLVFSKTEFYKNPKIKRIKKDEYSIFGKLYDIKSKLIKGDSIILEAYHDEKEENFYLTFANIYNNNPKSKHKIQNINYKELSPYILIDFLTTFIIDNCLSNTFYTNNSIKSIILDIQSPPPEIV